jgi:hypothetical protein
MPADDLILNVRQIAGYPPLDPVDPDFTVVVQAGLGGPYYSAQADVLVSTALLASPASLQVGRAAPANATGGQVFADAFCTGMPGRLMWNGYGDGAQDLYQAAATAAMLTIDPGVGLGYYTAGYGAAGTPIAWSIAFTVQADGYMSLADQLLLGRDPIAPMEAATVNWVQANTVATFNMRSGSVFLNLNDIVSAGGAPIYSPWLQGCPRAVTPLPGSNSTLLATTAFVTNAIVTAIDGINPAAFAPLDSPAFIGAPTAPTPETTPSVDNSTAIATTAFVVAVVNQLAASVSTTFAPIASPAFTGLPTGPTAAPGSATGQLATTAFVMNAVSASTAGVASFNTRTGAVTLQTTDVIDAGGAPIVSPAFTGSPVAPTAAPGTSSTQLATTAFVTLAIAAINLSGYAPLNSPALTGVPTAPTAAVGVSNNQLATTAFVANTVQAIDAGVTTFNGRSGAVQLTSADISAAGGAPLASPALYGTPTAPTAAPGTSTTQLATCAFVAAAIASVSGVNSFNTRTGAVTLSAADITAAGGALVAPTPTCQTFRANGTYTPPAGVRWIKVRLVGGGAGGGGTFTGNAGSVGGLSSFAGWTCNGGLGGAAGGVNLGGLGGLGGGSNTPGVNGAGSLIFRQPGGTGATGQWSNQTTLQLYATGGKGGDTPLGSTSGFLPSGGPPQPNGGAGGTGAPSGTQGNVGGAGGGGAGEYAEFFVASPASVAVVIGAGGAGGTAAGLPGQAGSAGLVIVEEFYT